jgi:hypothetical protein
MKIGEIIIDKRPVSFKDMDSLVQREECLSELVEKLYEKHITKIVCSRDEPVFYLDNVQSKMNKEGYVRIPWKRMAKVKG